MSYAYITNKDIGYKFNQVGQYGLRSLAASDIHQHLVQLVTLLVRKTNITYQKNIRQSNALIHHIKYYWHEFMLCNAIPVISHIYARQFGEMLDDLEVNYSVTSTEPYTIPQFQQQCCVIL